MEKKNLLYLFASFCLLIAMTIGASQLREAERSDQAYKESGSVKDGSRFPASVRKNKARRSRRRGGFLLSQREVLALNEKDLEKYLKGVARIISKAGKRNPKLFYDASVKTSSIWIYLQSEAFAQSSVSFEGGCLVGFVASVRADCESNMTDHNSLTISSSTRDRFSSLSDRGTSAICPSGRQMCSPAIYGFNFDSDGKASLICLRNASGQECFNEISTDGQGDRLKRSLELLAEANPEFWDNLGKGIIDICKPTSGGPEQDAVKADCALLKRQLATLTLESRGALAEYQNLAALMDGEVDSLDPLSRGGATPVPGADGETVSCSEVESAIRSQMTSNLDFASFGAFRSQNNQTSSTDLLRFASIACNKPSEELISQYGDCNIERPSNYIDSLSTQRTQVSGSAKARAAYQVVQSLNSLPASVRSQITSETSLADAVRILNSTSSSNESKAAFRKWEEFYDNFSRGNPVAAYEESQSLGADSLFSQMISNATNGGQLSRNQLRYLQDFRHNYGMDPINIKALFCPENGVDSHTFPENLTSNQSNFRDYTMNCLKQMGFRNRVQTPRTVTFPVLEDSTRVVQRQCEWTRSDFDSRIMSYFNGSSNSLPGNLYYRNINRISRTQNCMRIQACEYSRTGPGRDLAPNQIRSSVRGVKIDGQCLSNTQAISRLSTLSKTKFSTLSCADNLIDGSAPALSPGDMLDQERDRSID